MGTLAQVAVGAVAFALVSAWAWRVPRALQSASPLVVGLAAGAAIGAGTDAAAAATGAAVYDAVLRALGALAFVAAGCRASTRSLLLASAALAAPSLLGEGTAWPALAALGAALALVVLDTGGAAVGALVGLALGQAALRSDWPEPTGTTVAVGVVSFAIVAVSAFGQLHRRSRRRLVAATIGVAGVVVLLGLAWGLTALSVREDLARAVDIAKAGLDATRSGDTAAAAARFGEARRIFLAVDEQLGRWWAQPIRAVPIAAQNARALRVMTRAGAELADAGIATTGRADPDDVRPRNGVVPLEQVRALAEPLDDAASALADARRKLAGIESPWLAGVLASRLRVFGAEVTRSARDARTARLAVQVVPRLLGGDGERRYFVAFQTPAELRANGGLIGNFVEIRYRDGDIDLTRNARDSDYNQDNPGRSRTLAGPDDYVRRYSHYSPQYLIQSVTLSPDFPSVAEVLEHVYPQTGGSEIDGVISLDPIALGELLRLTGSVRVPGYGMELTPENTADVLLRDQYLRFRDTEVRVEFLKAAVRAVFDRLESTELPGPSRIGEVLGPMVRQGRLQLHSRRADEQAFFRRIGADRRFPPVRGGDFLGVVTQNATGNKIDVFQQRTVRYDARVDPATGRVRATATVAIRNDAPASGLPDYVIGSYPDNPLPLGTSRVLLSVYSPHRIVAATLDGVPVSVLVDEELGRNVFTAQLDIPPGGLRVLRFRLGGGVDLGASGGRYRLRWWHQATVNPDRVRMSVAAAPGWDVVALRGLRDTVAGAARSLTLREDVVVEARFRERGGRPGPVP